MVLWKVSTPSLVFSSFSNQLFCHVLHIQGKIMALILRKSSTITCKFYSLLCPNLSLKALGSSPVVSGNTLSNLRIVYDVKRLSSTFTKTNTNKQRRK